MNLPSTVRLERRLTQADFDRFARLSGDANPIHIDPRFAAETRFGRTVAHGLLLVSVLRGLIEQLAPGARLDSHEVVFPAPTFADELMSFSAGFDGNDGNDAHGKEIRLEVARVADGTVTCQGTARIRP
ncbi:MaoC family dehydratase [Elongatibacter sediminis]|uniref:MaoC/PaaZ C-terminal domain-containing protein n=1 Tax=Elongatibacter sediminis TaxID=3119006 RepID=A0AAW9RD52_9GAMM